MEPFFIINGFLGGDFLLLPPFFFSFMLPKFDPSNRVLFAFFPSMLPDAYLSTSNVCSDRGHIDSKWPHVASTYVLVIS